MQPKYWEMLFVDETRVVTNSAAACSALVTSFDGLSYYGNAAAGSYYPTEETKDSVLQYSEYFVGKFDLETYILYGLQQQDKSDDWLGDEDHGLLYFKFDFRTYTFEIWQMPEEVGDYAALIKAGILTNVEWQDDAE